MCELLMVLITLFEVAKYGQVLEDIDAVDHQELLISNRTGKLAHLRG